MWNFCYKLRGDDFEITSNTIYGLNKLQHSGQDSAGIDMFEIIKILLNIKKRDWLKMYLKILKMLNRINVLDMLDILLRRKMI